MPRYRITVAYDGTAYFGWQRQPSGCISVQQVLEEALAPFARRRAPAVSGGAQDDPAVSGGAQDDPAVSGGARDAPVVVFGSGRTDTGVHARGQVAHFDLEREIPPASIQRALNSMLPGDVRVTAAEIVPVDFHAQFSAHGKEYRYFVWNDEVMPPERRLYAHHVREPLDLGAMREAAQRFVGEHDFAAFTANGHRVVRTTVRTVYGVEVEAAEEGRLVVFRVRGSGFLYKMVRSIVGFLLSVGVGRERPEAVDEVMASRVRTARVASAPAKGLFLWEVFYTSESARPPTPSFPLSS